MVRSQRTGLATWPTIRSRNSRPSVTRLARLVRPDRQSRVGGLESGGEGAQGVDGGPHEAGVERAGDLQRDDARAGGGSLLQRGEGGQFTGDDDLAAAVEVRGLETQLGQLREQFGLVAAEHGAHAGLHLRGRVGHRDAALGDELHRVVLGQDAGSGRRGELTDRVAGDAAELVAATAVGHGGEAEQGGRDDQGLRDRGIPDRVGVADRAVLAQLDAGGVGQGIEMLGETGLGEPGFEESGGLRALSGRDDYDWHGFHPALPGAPASNEAHERIRKTLVVSHNAAD